MAQKKKIASEALDWKSLKAEATKISLTALHEKWKLSQPAMTLEGTLADHEDPEKIHLIPDPAKLSDAIEIHRSEVLSGRRLKDYSDDSGISIPRFALDVHSAAAALNGQQTTFEGSLRSTLVAETSFNTVDPGQCILWRQGQVRHRIITALAQWGQVPPESLRPTMTLGQLSKGVPWGPGQQANLVQAANANQVFAPFPSPMKPPPIVLDSGTSLADWERIVWTMQDPRSPCWGV